MRTAVEVLELEREELVRDRHLPNYGGWDPAATSTRRRPGAASKQTFARLGCRDLRSAILAREVFGEPRGSCGWGE